jgi:hypothetical protein
MSSKFEVGAIHELPLPQISEIAAKKIIPRFSNADALTYDIDSLSPNAILLCSSICDITCRARLITVGGKPANLPASIP